MKRSRVIALTLAGISLSLTGCRRSASVPDGGPDSSILPPTRLDPQTRSSLPAFDSSNAAARSNPPENAYDERLGYFHKPCDGWFPYPYNYHDPRYGYYRCGRWYKDRRDNHSGRTHHGVHRPWRTGTPRDADIDPQPPGAPVHEGISRAHASSLHGGAPTSRGGFGSTGHSSSAHHARS